MKDSKTLKRKDFLNLLAHSKNARKRKILLQWAEKPEIDAICECILNLLNGNVKISAKHLRKLNKHKHTLRQLCSKQYSMKKKKALLTQHGGFLQFLIPAALQSIPMLINILKKKKKNKK